jgi:hypothetical protein
VAAGALTIALVTVLPTHTASASQVSMATAASFGQPAGAGRAAGSAAGPADVAVLDVVMLVDESGSETPAKVADEKQTAGTIVQTMLNPRSRVTVIGFGGVNHVAPNQNPVDVACQPTIASGATNLGYLASCVNKLHRRSEAEGDDTDYAAALGQAMSYFNPATQFGQQSPTGAIKVVLMMTDGGVDVHRDTQQYGTDWQLGEQQAVNQQLAAARQYGAQVWPLGFGTDITPQAASYLGQLAKGGAQTACDSRQESEPHYQVVNDPSDALNALTQLYAEAGCLGTSVAPPVTVGGGVQAGTLHVTIPPIASDAAISVARGSPGVQVGYYLPDGTQWTDSSAISGQDSPVEVLHVANITGAEAGTWQIRLTAAPGLASQLVSATAFWQGAVRSVITADPPSAKLGQQIGVTLSVLGPNGPITDPSTLAQLQVGVSVSGDGLTGPASVPVTSAGETSGSATGVGDFKGTFTAPQKAGTLTFTGAAAGYGLYATEVPATVQVGTAVAGFTVNVQLPVVNSVQVGQGIAGQVNFVNQTSATRSVRLELTSSHGTGVITSPSGPITARSGQPPSVPFTITVDKDSPTGSAWFEVKAVDAANPGLVYSDVTMNVTVTRPPGFLARYLWVIIGIIALIVLAILALLWMRAAHRRKVDVRGLIAVLRRGGEQMGAELKAPSKWSDTFRFIIRDEEQPTARLDYPQPGFSAYTVKRAANGEVRLITPAGERYDVVVGGPGEVMEDNGLELAFRDLRRRRVAPRPAVTRPRQGGTPAGGPAPQTTPQPADQSSTIPSSPAPSPQDEWL